MERSAPPTNRDWMLVWFCGERCDWKCSTSIMLILLHMEMSKLFSCWHFCPTAFRVLQENTSSYLQIVLLPLLLKPGIEHLITYIPLSTCTPHPWQSPLNSAVKLTRVLVGCNQKQQDAAVGARRWQPPQNLYQSSSHSDLRRGALNSGTSEQWLGG